MLIVEGINKEHLEANRRKKITIRIDICFKRLIHDESIVEDCNI